MRAALAFAAESVALAYNFALEYSVARWKPAAVRIAVAFAASPLTVASELAFGAEAAPVVAEVPVEVVAALVAALAVALAVALAAELAVELAAALVVAAAIKRKQMRIFQNIRTFRNST